VVDRDSVRKAVREFQEQLGPIDLLIANAGIGRETTAQSFQAEDVEAQMGVNFLGVANCVEAVLPAMIERRRGQIAAISSMASYHGLPRMAGYCASKAAVNALLDGLRVELKPLGIDLTTICPGWVRTRLTDDIDMPLAHVLEVPDASRRILQAIRSRRPFAVFPWQVAWRVRLLSWLPATAGDWLVRRMLANRKTVHRR
jgi:short-subunit dehydrogenase